MMPPTKSALISPRAATSQDRKFLHAYGIKPYRTETFSHQIRKFDIMEPLTLKDLACAGLAILLCLLASIGVLGGTGMVWRIVARLWN